MLVTLPTKVNTLPQEGIYPLRPGYRPPRDSALRVLEILEIVLDMGLSLAETVAPLQARVAPLARVPPSSPGERPSPTRGATPILRRLKRDTGLHRRAPLRSHCVERGSSNLTETLSPIEDSRRL